jgi:hypothetical protein
MQSFCDFSVGGSSSVTTKKKDYTFVLLPVTQAWHKECESIGPMRRRYHSVYLPKQEGRDM